MRQRRFSCCRKTHSSALWMYMAVRPPSRPAGIMLSLAARVRRKILTHTATCQKNQASMATSAGMPHSAATRR